MPASDKTACPVCGEGETRVLLKEANVSCGDYFEGARLYKEDIGQTPLVKCTGCGFARFCDMHAWQAGTFRGRIYNDDYGRCDPPFEEERPARLAGWLAPLCAGKRLIDYGGGRGRTAQLLRDHDIDAVSYDPFYADALLPDWRADIVTAFEVVEHVPGQHALFEALLDLLAPGGVVLFSTLLQPDSLVPDWWYASPRNGHVSFHTSNSLAKTLRDVGADLISLSDEIHLAARDASALEPWYRVDPIAVNGSPSHAFTRRWDELAQARD
ncbi:class I SAM-dependent methyltransferase [Hyphomonadaceae bacterium BL14]|nr:class I SAM-dependent methyltransferase [Hyphomonadaceae bacterium BL14]